MSVDYGLVPVTRTEHLLFPRQSVSSSVQDQANSPSLSQLVSTLAPAAVFAAGYLIVFLILRTRIRRAYSPRTFSSELRPEERSPELPKALFTWFGTFFKLRDSFVLNHQSLDGFLLLRYLKISVVICLVGALVTWPILFPVNATGGGGQVQLNQISFSNIADDKRYYAHALLAWVFFGFVFYLVLREHIYYIHLRQAYLLSPLYATRMSARTVLFTKVPPEYRDQDRLRKMLGKDCKNVWVATNCSDLEKLVEKRDKTALKLERAETKLVKMANKERLRRVKKGIDTPDVAEGGEDDLESGSAAARWVPAKKRPTHRLKLLFGRKVDTIEWCRAELKTLIPQVNAEQDKIRQKEGKRIPAAFAEYYTQIAAQEAYQGLAHHQALHMERFIGINPEEIIWRNLNINWASLVVRYIAITALVSVLIIFWAIPVAFVGALSNIQALASGDPTANPPKPPLLPWLSFINKIPDVILGVVQGLLPSVLLAALMALLPPFLYLLAKITGPPTLAAVELRVQNYYFVFQLFQVFLVTTIASSASAAVVQIINRPQDATNLLAENLPKASNFYISYFILQGLAIASGSLAQILEILIFMLLHRLFDSTPRKIYRRFVELSCIGWGSEFPTYTLLTVIAITYSMIAPLVLGFATVGMYLIYLAYKYNFLFVFNSDVDTKGLCYPRALQQTTVGCYLGIICLIGLFAIKHVPGPLILMFILLITAVLFHWSINSALEPLLHNLPRSLQVEEQSLLALEAGDADAGDKEVAVTTAEANGHTSKSQPEQKKPSFFIKFLLPHKYDDYYALRKIVPRSHAEIRYEPEVERDAYYHPSVKEESPTVWIPRDPMGVSTQECRHNNAMGITTSDEDAGFNEKGKLVWDREVARPPVYEEKVYY